MRLDPDGEVLPGLTGRRLRELFRRPMQLMVCNVADFLGVNMRTAVATLVELERLGYVEPDPLFGGRARRSTDAIYRPTGMGNAVAKARFTKPMSRSRADRHVADLVARAREAATMPFSWQIVEVQLFGSAADAGRPDVGDIDVAVGLAPRFPFDRRAQEAADRARVVAGGKSGVSAIFWPREEPLKFLKNGRGVVDVTTTDDPAFLAAERGGGARALFVADRDVEDNALAECARVKIELAAYADVAEHGPPAPRIALERVRSAAGEGVVCGATASATCVVVSDTTYMIVDLPRRLAPPVGSFVTFERDRLTGDPTPKSRAQADPERRHRT